MHHLVKKCEGMEILLHEISVLLQILKSSIKFLLMDRYTIIIIGNFDSDNKNYIKAETMIFNKISKLTLVKFLLGIIAGLGLIGVYKFVAEVELNEEEEFEIYDEEYDHPLFV